MTPLRSWNDRTIPALGLGCWAIGGPFFAGDQPLGWGDVDDGESVRAIHAGYAGGLRFFDTSDAYGTGHSEEVLGEALRSRPDAVVATKFRNTYDRKSRQLTGIDVSPGAIRRALESSCARLRRERLDLYQLHVDTLGPEATEVHETLSALVEEGRIGGFGWSTDSLDQARRWPASSAYAAVQHACNLFNPARDLMRFCEETGCLSINRSPLAMALLTAKFDGGDAVRGQDVRAQPPAWLPYFANGRPRADFARRLDAVRELLMTGGRTLAQGALGWIWASGPATLPIPGFRTVAQVEENLGALDHGALPAQTKDEIDALLSGA